jgi:hypothetical protein
MEKLVNIKKFREAVFSKITKEDSLYQLMQSKPDEIPAEEAVYLTSTVMGLINHSKLAVNPQSQL